MSPPADDKTPPSANGDGTDPRVGRQTADAPESAPPNGDPPAAHAGEASDPPSKGATTLGDDGGPSETPTDEAALARVPEDDGGAALAALEKALAGVEVEPGADLVAPVAVDAVALEERANLGVVEGEAARHLAGVARRHLFGAGGGGGRGEGDQAENR